MPALSGGAFITAPLHSKERNPVVDSLRRVFRTRWPEWDVLACYAVLISLTIPFHEPWADEAQAWQLSRSLSLHDLFHTYIRYEGAPGLWHFLLWVMIRTHVGYSGLHWICGGIALAGVACFVLASPFPRYLRLLLPFTYFLLFQYAVIARSYVLIPLILFVIAWRWKGNPVFVALMLGLLANLALHAAVISCGLAVSYLIEKIFCENDDRGRLWRQLWFAGLILFMLYIFALWTAWPPHDLSMARARGVSQQFILNFIAAFVMGICQPWILSIPFWGAIAFCLYARRRLFYLLPVVLFAMFSGAVQVQFWHGGLLVPLVICLLWITWPGAQLSGTHSEVSARVAMLVLAGTQILWSGYSLMYDHSRAYSADLAAAKFLKPFVDRGGGVALTYIENPSTSAYLSVGILPYFDRNIFINQPAPFWLWSDTNPTEANFLPALQSHPEFVLVEIAQMGDSKPSLVRDPKIQIIRSAGYEPTQLFCGRMPKRLTLEENRCHWIFQRADALQSAVDVSSQQQNPEVRAALTARR